MTDTIEVLRPGKIGGLEIHRPAELVRYINMLVYGDPGVGKTVLAASAAIIPEMSPVLVVDVEGGDMSLVRQAPGVDVVRIKNFRDFNTLYAAIRAGEGNYKTVVMDSITEVGKFSMYEVMRQMLLDPKNKDRDPDMPSIAEWGKNIEQVRKLVRAFRDLEMNCIITALAKHDMNDEGVIRKTQVSLPGKLAHEIPGFFDIVGYMYIKEARKPHPTDEKKTIPTQVRCLLTQATQRQVAKDRTGVLPPVLEDPTMASIFNITNAGQQDTQQSEATK